jgi:hypothetical protein
VIDLDIEEVERILNAFPLLPKPKYVFMIEEDVKQKLNGEIIYRGLTPKWRSDVIILTPRADKETVVHEFLHTLGLGEEAAYILSPIITKVATMRPSLLRRGAKYRECSGCEFKYAHDRGIKHYILTS